MKRPDRKAIGLLMAVLVALGAAGCGGINANVPVSPMWFIQHPGSSPAPTSSSGSALALNDAAAPGQ